MQFNARVFLEELEAGQPVVDMLKQVQIEHRPRRAQGMGNDKLADQQFQQ